MLRLALAWIAFAASSPLLAQTYVVNSPIDEIDADLGDGICQTKLKTCSLRAAVMEASRATGSATVNIVLSAGIYPLYPLGGPGDGEAGGDLDFNTPTSGSPWIVLAGAGMDATVVDADWGCWALEVHVGAQVVVKDLTLWRGYAHPLAGGDAGGGVRVAGRAILDHVEVDESYAAYGGALYVSAEPSAELVLRDARIRNSLASYGGGLYALGAVIIERSNFSDNLADSGGAILAGWGAELAIVDSTFSGNGARGFAGGIGVFADAIANIYSSTIAFNRADADTNGDGDVGGIAVNGFAELSLRNSLVAGNYVVGATGGVPDCSGTVVSRGRNLFGSVAGCTVVIGNGSWGLLNDLGLLGPLRSNGGLTATHELITGSNAIDGGDPTGCNGPGVPLSTDQRGAPRALGAHCDVGAYEAGAPFLDGFESGGLSGWSN